MSPRPASIAGRAAIGSCCPGFLVAAGMSDSEHDRSAIPFIGRWKMLDNLRRTLSAPAIFLALLAGWMLPLDAAVVWTAFVVATFAIPAFLPAFVGIMPRRFGLSQRRHWYMVGADFALASLQLALLITLVASQAWLMADAILRTLFRLFVRRRKLLEWVTAAQSKVSARLRSLRDVSMDERRRWAGGCCWCHGRMGGASIVAHRSAIHNSLDPFTGCRASGRVCPLFLPSANPVTGADAQALRLTARRTWRFLKRSSPRRNMHFRRTTFRKIRNP